MENGGHGTPAASRSMPERLRPAISRTSPSMTSHSGRFIFSVLQASLSLSIAATWEKPACSNPNDCPPAPAHNSTTVRSDIGRTFNECRDNTSNPSIECAFSNGKDSPASASQSTGTPTIAFLCRCKLRAPISSVHSWFAATTAFVSVPETSMHKDSHSMSREHEIRFSGQCLSVKSVPKSERMNFPANQKFWVCVPAPNSRHVSAATGTRWDQHLRSHSDRVRRYPQEPFC